MIETEVHPDRVVVVEASLIEARRLADRCASVGITSWIGGQECCSSGGCGPKAALLVGREDAPRVADLLRREWLDALEREQPGMSARMAKLHEEAHEGELPCPACGTAAALVSGACSDCGLQLE